MEYDATIERYITKYLSTNGGRERSWCKMEYYIIENCYEIFVTSRHAEYVMSKMIDVGKVIYRDGTYYLGLKAMLRENREDRI